MVLIVSFWVHLSHSNFGASVLRGTFSNHCAPQPLGKSCLFPHLQVAFVRTGCALCLLSSTTMAHQISYIKGKKIRIRESWNQNPAYKLFSSHVIWASSMSFSCFPVCKMDVNIMELQWPIKRVCVCVCVCVQLCPTFCDPMDCSPLGSSVHGIL